MNEDDGNTCPWCDAPLDSNDKCIHRSCINYPDEYEDNDDWFCEMKRTQRGGICIKH